MSFTDNQKILGWAFFIIGILMIVSALIQIWDGATAEDDIEIWGIVAGIGALIAAVLYFLYGNKVRVGTITGKLNILGQFIRVIGVNAVITGVFSLGVDWVSGICSIIFGLILVWVAGKVLDGKETTIDKIIWIILLVVFVIMFLLAFVSIFTTDVIGLIAALCEAIVYLFMIAYMLDGDVKKAMNM